MPSTALRKQRKKANAKIINIADVPKCSDKFWEHPPPAGDAEVLPLNTIGRLMSNGILLVILH